MKKIKLIFALLASLMLGACSSSDDSNNGGSSQGTSYTMEPQSEAPVWQVNWDYNQEKPDWQEPNPSIYENWTIMLVQMEEELKPHVSEEDMVAVFVNNELRGLAPTPTKQEGKAYFLFKAYGNEASSQTVNVSLRYYSQKLKQIFTLSDNIKINSDETTGIDTDFIPPFTQGSAKYPVSKTLIAESLLTRASITTLSDNIVGAFVGNECRGTVKLSSSGTTPLVIHGRSTGESVTLKYYDATKGVMFTIDNALNL